MGKVLLGTALCVGLLACNYKEATAKHPLDNMLGLYDVRVVDVNGVTCIIAGYGGIDSGAAISCNWKEGQ